MKSKIKSIFKQIGYPNFGGVLVSTVVLLTIAFYNTSPLTFNADSAMYIESAHRRVIEPDRPILYGLFIKYFSFNTSLWLVIIAQSLIVSFVLQCYFNSFGPENNGRYSAQKKSNVFLIVFCVLVSLCMGASFQVSWIMADIFTPISILLMGGILFFKNISPLKLGVLSIMLIFSASMHNSNFYICLSLIVIIAFTFLFKSIRKQYSLLGFTFKRILLAFLLLVLSNVTLSTIQFFYGGEFKSSRGGVVFLMGNIVEMGIIDQYLNDQCGKKNYELCNYKDSIPNNFLWDARSPIHKTGGWKGSEKEYSVIIKDILTTPKYLKTFVFSSAVLTLKQFFVFETGEADKPWRRVSLAVRNYYDNDFDSFITSKQSKQKLNFTSINFLQNVVFALCLFIYIIALSSTSNVVETRYKLLAIYMILSIVINAWICGTFSGVFPRYQSRVVWLMPLPIFLFVMARWPVKSANNSR
ncbi:hypothetical protein LX99_05065 [Mucilaginibacter oryzae]|uniref:Dolichyl-phosphate-mannose-protein mannosyltransferase n=1 Tax=Mucilaginibacter oryzae TaxID=468058 RepID=A0A316GW02_9SPHI|nr:hypothetical protein [Mucilaginibacter oryzae]PWK64901.1 hypothetical protein LX99_05065 [Mucilaginibacter oryzae]